MSKIQKKNRTVRVVLPSCPLHMVKHFKDKLIANGVTNPSMGDAAQAALVEAYKKSEFRVP